MHTPTKDWPAEGLSLLGPKGLGMSGLRGGSVADLKSPPALAKPLQLLRWGSWLCLARA